MDQLQDDERKSDLIAHHLDQAQREREAVKLTEHPKAQRSNVNPAETIPSPPSWGSHVVAEMPLEIVFQDIFKKELFRLSWGAKNAHGAEWEELKADFERRLAAMQAQALAEGWLQPKGVYGYWPAQSQGDDLILFTPDSVKGGNLQELFRFTFPRQSKDPGLCLADYFATLESGVIDVVALQIVTIGSEATARVDALQQSGDYAEAYYAHGLAVQTAEAAAQYLHRHIRRELGIDGTQGKRYSWGYPSIPDLNDHVKVFQLLPAEQSLGMRLSPAFQLIPEQSTAAIILHHPQAKYFSVGVSRVEQLMGEQQNPSSPIGGEGKGEGV
jgi:5-methyltetrahydrofolate--homocysteine methyltransferase